MQELKNELGTWTRITFADGRVIEIYEDTFKEIIGGALSHEDLSEYAGQIVLHLLGVLPLPDHTDEVDEAIEIFYGIKKPNVEGKEPN